MHNTDVIVSRIIDYQLVLCQAFEEDKTLSNANGQNILYFSRYNIYEAGKICAKCLEYMYIYIYLLKTLYMYIYVKKGNVVYDIKICENRKIFYIYQIPSIIHQ